MTAESGEERTLLSRSSAKDTLKTFTNRLYQ
jgi:hypothetical protein